jgi:hypothetical protein
LVVVTPPVVVVTPPWVRVVAAMLVVVGSVVVVVGSEVVVVGAVVLVMTIEVVPPPVMSVIDQCERSGAFPPGLVGVESVPEAAPDI